MTFYLYDGKFLLDDGKFAISEDCCCESVSSTCYLLRECDADSNTCNSCDPPIPDTLYVTITGLTGGEATYNGTHAVDWSSGCNWNSSNLGSGITSRVEYDSGEWTFELGVFGLPPSRIIIATGSTDGCTPDGGYSNEPANPPYYPSTTGSASVSYTDPTSSTVGANELCVNDDLSSYAFGNVIKYDGTCYYFLGIMECSSPTTMGTWSYHPTCEDCNGPILCNSCDPNLHIYYTITITGTGTGLDGTWGLENEDGGTSCVWLNWTAGSGLGLEFFWNGSNWKCYDGDYMYSWTGSSDSCTPTGAFTGSSGSAVVS